MIRKTIGILKFFTYECYPIKTANDEDVNLMLKALEVLENAGYKTASNLVAGTLFGYVYCKLYEFDKLQDVIANHPKIQIADSSLNIFERFKLL